MPHEHNTNLPWWFYKLLNLISMAIDLKKEQQSTLDRPRLNYAITSRLFFFGMDLVAGKKNVLPKAKLLEILACIPYRQWELRQYFTLTMKYFNSKKVDWAQEIIAWGREAQDNEYQHLLVIQEKMKEDGIRNKWYLAPFIVFFMVTFYIFLSKVIAWTSIKAGFRFNAEFEDHAEHVYAQMVKDNPQWEEQKVTTPVANAYANVESWADIFRQISLDERDHRNHSFYYAGKNEKIVNYEGMPKPH